MKQKELHIIGYASGIAAGDSGCQDGPLYFQKTDCLKAMQAEGIELTWVDMIKPNETLQDKYQIVEQLNQALANVTFELSKKQQKFVVIGGDHSSGIGTWSGAYQAIKEQGDLGLVWIDAHLDANTPETSPSDNIHGMPVACLLGHGDQHLIHIMDKSPKLKPEHVCVIGARSYEKGEWELLNRLGVRIYCIEEVQKRGFAAVFQEALAHVRQNTAAFGISLDLDGLDPEFAPGVGTPVAGGLKLSDVCHALQNLPQPEQCIGFEIAEFNPHQCPDGRTAKTICELINAWLRSYP